MNNEYKIINIEWRSAAHTVGFVAYETGNPANPGEWNSVVGYRPDIMQFGNELIQVPSAEEFDAQYIAAHGAQIEWQIAKILFPRLDIKKHKYYNGTN